jgi:hypothetical protein
MGIMCAYQGDRRWNLHQAIQGFGMVQTCKVQGDLHVRLAIKMDFPTKSPPGSRWLNVPGLPAHSRRRSSPSRSDACGISRPAAFALKPESGRVVTLYSNLLPATPRWHEGNSGTLEPASRVFPYRRGVRKINGG